MQPDTITISLGQFASEQVNPAEVAEKIISAREAGFRLQLKVDQPEALGVLGQLPSALKKQESRRMGMPGVIGLAAVVSLGFMLYLWMVMMYF